MKHKGPIWVIIFFCIIAFILINTLDDINQLNPVEVNIQGKGPYPADTTITKSIESPETKEEIYQVFHLQINEKDNIMEFSVSTKWIQTNGIDENSIKLFKQTEGKTWEQLTIQKKQSYNQEVSFSTPNATTSNYYISGIAHAEKKEETGINIQLQLILLIGTITLLLFIAYHHTATTEEKKHENKKPGEEDIKEYIKASLLAGHEEKAIKERLEKAGWDKKVIEKGIKKVRFF